MEHNIKSIGVFVGEDLLGDGILKIPFVLCLKDHFPQAEITWITGKGKSVFSSLLAPLVKDKVDHIIDTAPIGKSWFSYLKTPPISQEFDLLIDTQRDLHRTLCVKKIPHQRFYSRTWNYHFSDFKPTTKKKIPHLTDNLINIISIITGQDIHQRYTFDIPTEFLKNVDGILPNDQDLIGLSPGAGQPFKIWPTENFITLGQKVLEKGKWPVFILGPTEEHMHQMLKEGVPEALFPLQEHPDLLASPINTMALACHFEQSVANDSGTGHLLAAGGNPITSLFGKTDPKKVHPYTEKITLIQSPTGEMKDISVESVLQGMYLN